MSGMSALSAALPDQDGLVELFDDGSTPHIERWGFASAVVVAGIVGAAVLALLLTMLLLSVSAELMMMVAEQMQSCISRPWPFGDGKLVCP